MGWLTIALKFLASLASGLYGKWRAARDAWGRGKAEAEADALAEENERLRLAAEARERARDDIAGQPDGELRDDGHRRD